MRVRVDIEWTDAELWRLRELWGEGMSATAIGRAMGRSKSSIIGKAHRLLLKPRLSPIVTNNAWTEAETAEMLSLRLRHTVRQIAAIMPGRSIDAIQCKLSQMRIANAASIGTLPPLPSAGAAVGTKPSAPRAVRIAPAPAAPLPLHTSRTCQYPGWPNGARPGRNPLFCGAPAVAVGCGSWCAVHRAVVFTRAGEMAA